MKANPLHPVSIISLCILFISLSVVADATQYGSIIVNYEPKQEAGWTHGYIENVFRVMNISPTKTQTVRIAIPASSYSGSGLYCAENSRTPWWLMIDNDAALSYISTNKAGCDPACFVYSP